MVAIAMPHVETRKAPIAVFVIQDFKGTEKIDAMVTINQFLDVYVC